MRAVSARRSTTNEQDPVIERAIASMHARATHNPQAVGPALLPALLVLAAIIGTMRAARAERRPTWTRGGLEHGRHRRWPGADDRPCRPRAAREPRRPRRWPPMTLPRHPRSRAASRLAPLTKPACAPCACWGLPARQPSISGGRRLVERPDEHLAHTPVDYVAPPAADTPAWPRCAIGCRAGVHAANVTGVYIGRSWRFARASAGARTGRTAANRRLASRPRQPTWPPADRGAAAARPANVAATDPDARQAAGSATTNRLPP